MEIKIYTGASDEPNPGPMSWAWFDSNGEKNQGGVRYGTNNIGKLEAVWQAIYSHPEGDLVIYTDDYVCGVVEGKYKPKVNKSLIYAIRKKVNEHRGKVDLIDAGQSDSRTEARTKVQQIISELETRQGLEGQFMSKHGWETIKEHRDLTSKRNFPDDALRLLSGELSYEDYHKEHSVKK